jgi:hypothetical protein
MLTLENAAIWEIVDKFLHASALPAKRFPPGNSVTKDDSRDAKRCIFSETPGAKRSPVQALQPKANPFWEAIVMTSIGFRGALLGKVRRRIHKGYAACRRLELHYVEDIRWHPGTLTSS